MNDSVVSTAKWEFIRNQDQRNDEMQTCILG